MRIFLLGKEPNQASNLKKGRFSGLLASRILVRWLMRWVTTISPRAVLDVHSRMRAHYTPENYHLFLVLSQERYLVLQTMRPYNGLELPFPWLLQLQ
jgi:hypothetical protein